MAYQKIGFKNGNVLTAEQLIHMEDGIINAEKKPAGGGTGAGLPSDVGAYKYMATDGNGEWQAVDRLAWKEVETKKLVEEANVVIEAAGVPVQNPFSLSGFVEGDTYTVIWDRTEYSCVAYVDEGLNCVGNGSIAEVTGGSNEPFFIGVFGDNTFVFSSETGTHTISIVGSALVPHPIPDEYLDFLEENVEITVLTWDGNIEGLQAAPTKYGTLYGPFATSYSAKDFVEKKGEIVSTASSANYTKFDEQHLTDDKKIAFIYFTQIGSYSAVVVDNGATFDVEDPSGNKTTLTSGVWLVKHGSAIWVDRVFLYDSIIKPEHLPHPIPAEYLPSYDAVIEWNWGSEWNQFLPAYDQLALFSDSSNLYSILRPILKAGKRPKILLHGIYGDNEYHAYYTPILVNLYNYDAEDDVIFVFVLSNEAAGFTMRRIDIEPSGITACTSVSFA